jgi:uncharacterized protein (TIGR03086 family)
VNVVELHRRALASFDQRVRAVRPHQWRHPTPCADWSVRELVNHVVNENLWTPPLLAGRTIAEVGDRFDGDLLGDDPATAWAASAAEAGEAAAAPGAPAATAHLSFGDVPGEVYLRQLFADLLIHGWDLARATGGSEALDQELVAECADWFTGEEAAYRGAGLIAPRPALGDDAGPQDRLLAAFGRDPSPDTPLAVLRRFTEAFGARDVDGVMAVMTEDCVFESTAAPDGRRYEGQAAVRGVWEELFGATPDARFDVEEGVLAGDRGTYRWRYDWGTGHVRGVDIFRVRAGKVAEKLSYVKG